MDTGKDMGMVIMEVVAIDMVIIVIMEVVDMGIMEEVDMDIMEEEGMDTTTTAITMEKDLSAPLNILQMKILKRDQQNLDMAMGKYGYGYGIGGLGNGYGNGE
jgi:hypothetical protein